MSLAGRTALVTGGGRGIGAAIAERLALEGARVAVAARSLDQVEAVAASLRERGAEAAAFACDVTVEDEVARLVRETEAALGPVDVLVCNAGAATSAPLDRTTLDDWNRMLAVNATGPFLCVRAVLDGMTSRCWGRVVVVASVAGLAGARYISAYAASKHAAVGLVRVAAAEAARGVTVNAVCPGYVDTEMTRETIRRIVETTGADEAGARDALLRRSPQRRLIEPAEVAHAVASLCAEEARGIHGQCVVIDGGETMR
ncbi:MAG TPA: SDR family NAD(P)-dependent oxidoreductase [Thermoanaerobaculia bacterium]|nr:SDR family NAD(P)-dependent oxidoreductase [Thermoanaerobaculia bacterium]